MLTWLDFKDSQRHINICYETIGCSTSESWAPEKKKKNRGKVIVWENKHIHRPTDSVASYYT